VAEVRLLAVLATFGLLLCPARTALASTASIEFDSLYYVAAPAETNHLVITLEGGAFRISDPGVPITVGPGCAAAGADVLCGDASLSEGVFVKLGDGDDSADLLGIGMADVEGEAGNDDIIGAHGLNYLLGGPGNDHLTGGQQDVLHGGAGDDQLLLGPANPGWPDQASGGPGNDTIIGGPGGRQIIGGGPGDDILDGGPGRDEVHAKGMNLRVTPTALIGEGEGSDTLSGFELAALFGGTGSNVINARAWRGATYIDAMSGDDVIVGGFGPDRIDAGAGDDRIAGRAGRDVLLGRWGADVLFTHDLAHDQVNGGPGRDRARVDRLDTTALIEVFFF
jgi:Ca2+-binding RTX toxin-like protein